MANTYRNVAINRKGTPWSTATAADCNLPTAGVLTNSWPAVLERTQIDASTPGKAHTGKSWYSSQDVVFDAEMPWQYDMGMMIMLAAMMSGDTKAGTGPYTHTMAPPGVSGLIGRIVSAAWQELTTAGGAYRNYEIYNLKVSRIKISGAVGQLLMVSFPGLVGDTIDVSATTNTTLEDATWPDTTDLQGVSGDVFTLAAQNSAPSSLSISSFELEFGQNVSADHVIGPSEYVNEPSDQASDESAWTGTLSVTRPRKLANTYEAALQAGTVMNGVLNFTGDSNNALEIRFPQLAIVTAGNPDNEETITWNIQADESGTAAHEDATPATATAPLGIVVTNDSAISYNAALA